MTNELLTNILLGICLSAACGYRALLPAAIVSLSVMGGHVITAPAFAWLGSPVTASVLLLVAVAEVIFSFLRAADRPLELVSAPLAMVTGSLLAMAVLHDVGLATGVLIPLVAGMAVAGTSQSIVSLLRARAIAANPAAHPRAAALSALGSILLATTGVFAPAAGGILAIVFLAARSRDLRDAIRR